MELIQGFWEAIRTGNLPDLGQWSYVLIALLVFVEGPSVTLVAGAMAATGILRPELVFVAAAAGNIASDQFWYWLGRLGAPKASCGDSTGSNAARTISPRLKVEYKSTPSRCT